MLQVLIGGTLASASFGLIIIPQKFAAGGVTGLSVILSHAISLPVSTLVLIFNILLFGLGWIFLGLDFVMKTLLMSIYFPFMLDIFQKITVFQVLSTDPLFSALLAGNLLALGGGLVLRGNGSNGGFDILGMILFKKFKIPVSVVMYVCDIFVIAFQAFSQPLMNTVYGIVVVLLSSILIGKVITYGCAEVQFLIFSNAYESIRKELLGPQNTGVTMLNGESGYYNQHTKAIVTIVPYAKVASIKKSIQDIDPLAFVVISDVRTVIGRGYTFNRYV